MILRDLLLPNDTPIRQSRAVSEAEWHYLRVTGRRDYFVTVVDFTPLPVLATGPDVAMR